MKHLILIVVLVLSLSSLHGCGSRLQHNDAVADKLGDGPGQFNAEVHGPSNTQIERDGLREPGTTRIEETSRPIEEAAQDSAGEQVRVLRRQADLLEQIEGYTVRFDVAVDALMPDNELDRYNALIDRIQKGATAEAKLQQMLLEL